MQHKYHGIYERFFKRPLDFVFALMAFVILSPCLLVIAFLVRIKLGSPVIFVQDRPGMIDRNTGKEKIFKLYKFRSMTDKKDEKGNLLPDDIRLTKFGKFLRATSLDELPELVNVIKGDMSIVGPRPLLVKYLERYTTSQRRRHEVRPGITGLAMATVRNSMGWDKKFELDLKYIDNVSLLLDFKIILWSVIIVLKREGINEPGSATNTEFMGILEEKK